MLGLLSDLAAGDLTLDYPFYLRTPDGYKLVRLKTSSKIFTARLTKSALPEVNLQLTNERLATVCGAQFTQFAPVLPISLPALSPLIFDKDYGDVPEFQAVVETDPSGSNILRLKASAGGKVEIESSVGTIIKTDWDSRNQRS